MVCFRVFIFRFVIMIEKFMNENIVLEFAKIALLCGSFALCQICKFPSSVFVMSWEIGQFIKVCFLVVRSDFLKCECVSEKKKEERIDVKTMEDGLEIVKAWFKFLFFFIVIDQRLVEQLNEHDEKKVIIVQNIWYINKMCAINYLSSL